MLLSDDLTATTLHVPEGIFWQTEHSLARGFCCAEMLQRQEGNSVLAAPLTMLPLIYNMKSRMCYNLPSSKQVSGL